MTVCGVGKFENFPIVGIVDRVQLANSATWRTMLSRCYSVKNRAYPLYGGRGVTVCDDWLEFQKFAKWYETNYVPGWKIDKDLIIPGNKVYSPDGCCLLPEKIHQFITHGRIGLPTPTDSGRWQIIVWGGADFSVRTCRTFDTMEECIEEKRKSLKDKMEALIPQFNLEERTVDALRDHAARF